MQKRRMLLATTALTTMTFIGCRKEMDPLPGNPKGSMYDAAAEVPPADATPPVDPRASTLPPLVDPRASTRIPPPANPKGSHYDAGLRPKTSKE